MKKHLQNSSIWVPLLLLFIITGCKSDYLENFQPFDKDLIEYQFEGLPAPIKSPFDGEMVHPMGRIDITSKSGDPITVTLVNTIPNQEIPEIAGVVYAEIVQDGKRVDKMEVASGESVVGYHSELDPPYFKLVYYGGEHGELEFVKIYEALPDSFTYTGFEDRSVEWEGEE